MDIQPADKADKAAEHDALPDQPATALAMDLANGNTTAIEAISERLSEVTALAEQLDRALTAARLDPSAPPPPPSVEDATDAPGEEPAAPSDQAGAAPEDAVDSPAERSDATTTEEWRSTLDLADSDAEAASKVAVAVAPVSVPAALVSSIALPVPAQTRHSEESCKSETEEFVTASECTCPSTCTPPSRSSSFHTASEGGVASPWWELEPTSEEGDDADLDAAAAPQQQAWVTKQVQTEAAMPLPVAAELPAEVKTVVQHHVYHLPDTEEHPASCEEGEREVLAGVLVQREVRETRQLRVRRGGGETRAESELSCSRIEAHHINNACNASTSSTASATSTLSSGTRGALDAVLHTGHDDVDAAYRQQLEESLPLPLPLDLDLDLQLPSPLAFADHVPVPHPYGGQDDDDDVHDDYHDDLEMPPPPPQELLDGLKEVSLRDENANHVMLSCLEPPLPPPPPPLQPSARFLCQPHIMRHAIKGVF